MFKHDDLLIITWANTILASTWTEPVLSILAYTGSIAGSIVYIYTTLKKNKDKTP